MTKKHHIETEVVGTVRTTHVSSVDDKRANIATVLTAWMAFVAVLVSLGVGWFSVVAANRAADTARTTLEIERAPAIVMLCQPALAAGQFDQLKHPPNHVLFLYEDDFRDENHGEASVAVISTTSGIVFTVRGSYWACSLTNYERLPALSLSVQFWVKSETPKPPYIATMSVPGLAPNGVFDFEIANVGHSLLAIDPGSTSTFAIPPESIGSAHPIQVNCPGMSLGPTAAPAELAVMIPVAPRCSSQQFNLGANLWTP